MLVFVPIDKLLREAVRYHLHTIELHNKDFSSDKLANYSEVEAVLKEFSGSIRQLSLIAEVEDLRRFLEQTCLTKFSKIHIHVPYEMDFETVDEQLLVDFSHRFEQLQFVTLTASIGRNLME